MALWGNSFNDFWSYKVHVTCFSFISCGVNSFVGSADCLVIRGIQAFLRHFPARAVGIRTLRVSFFVNFLHVRLEYVRYVFHEYCFSFFIAFCPPVLVCNTQELICHFTVNTHYVMKTSVMAVVWTLAVVHSHSVHSMWIHCVGGT